MKGLSILIPEYCDSCVEQVRTLCAQCKGIEGLSWEIVVCDDGSPTTSFEKNKDIAAIDGCRLIRRKTNCGRSVTRNYLAAIAKYDTLLYIDSGLMPNPHLVEKYVENMGKSLVVCGNIAVAPECINMESLRCRNELKAQKRFTAARHAKDPYRNFHSGNFMIDRRTILDNPFREDIKTYGYEDTLFGKHLCEKGISILHIDNPVMFVRFESNDRFLEKTREALSTLYTYRYELTGYSPLLYVVEWMRLHHILWLPTTLFKCFGAAITANLKGTHPNLMLFTLYRLCLLAKMISAG